MRAPRRLSEFLRGARMLVEGGVTWLRSVLCAASGHGQVLLGHGQVSLGEADYARLGRALLDLRFGLGDAHLVARDLGVDPGEGSLTWYALATP